MHAHAQSKPRLLFVDDERRVLNSMRAMFRRDYELFLTTRGDEALKIIAEQAIDVLVADQRMPVMTGVEVLTAARKRSPGTVRILLTGYSDPDAIEGAKTDGKVFRFLNKPCAADELRTIISEAVRIARETPRQAVPTLVVNRTQPLGRGDEDNEDQTPAQGEPPTLTAVHQTGGTGSPTGEKTYEVDEFTDTDTMEIVMSGDTITVFAQGDDAPQSYRAPVACASWPEAPAADTPSTDAPEFTDDAPTGPDEILEEPPAAALKQAPVPVEKGEEPRAAAAPPKPQPARGRSRHSGLDVGRDSPTLLLYVFGGLLAVLGLAWLALNFGEPDVPATLANTTVTLPTPEPVTSTPARPTLAKNLELGALALDSGALIAPGGASALDFYLDARGQAPADAAVMRGLDRLSAQIALSAREQLTRQEFTGVLASLDALTLINAQDTRVAALRSDLDLAIDEQFVLVDGAIESGQWETADDLIDQLASVPLVETARIDAAREALNATRERVAELAAAAQARAAAAAARAEARAAAETQAATAAAAETQAASVAAAETQAATAAAAETQAEIAEPEIIISATPTPAETIETIATTATEPEALPYVPTIDELFGSAEARLAAGRLTTPADDSAWHYLQQIQRVEPDNPRLAARLTGLGDALVQRALSEARNSDWQAADATLSEAESVGVPGARLARVREQIASDRAMSETRIVPIREMQALELVPARYPPQARRANTEGWALLHFTVQPDGSVSDIEAVETSGRYGGRFAQAARAAAAKWTFEPRLNEGRPIAQRVEARVKFELAE